MTTTGVMFYLIQIFNLQSALCYMSLKERETAGTERTFSQSKARTEQQTTLSANSVRANGRDMLHGWCVSGGCSFYQLWFSLQRFDTFIAAQLRCVCPYPSSKWCSSFSQSLQCPWSSTSSFSGSGAVSFSSAIFDQEVRGDRRVPSTALTMLRSDWLRETHGNVHTVTHMMTLTAVLISLTQTLSKQIYNESGHPFLLDKTRNITKHKTFFCHYQDKKLK